MGLPWRIKLRKLHNHPWTDQVTGETVVELVGDFTNSLKRVSPAEIVVVGDLKVTAAVK